MDGDEVLSVTEQADDIAVAFGLKTERLHRKASHSPGTQAREFAQLPQSRGALRRHTLNGFERRDGRVEHVLCELNAALRCVVPRCVNQIGLSLGARWARFNAA